MRIENQSRLLSACLLFAGLASIGATAARSQALPDLRGRSLSITGNLTASGTITYLFFPVNIANFLPAGGAVIPANRPAQLTISASGPAADSALTGSTAIGSFDETVNGVFYPGWKNPSLPLTSGHFDRTTGAFSMSGTLAGVSVIDFGVHDLSSAGMGIKRILIQFNNLGITLSGMGALEAAGVFTIKNPNSSAFTFTSNSATPALSAQDPALTAFKTSGDYVISGAAFALNNWTAQAIVSGSLSLEGVPDLTKISPNAQLNPFTFSFRAPGSTTPIFSLSASLMPVAGSPNGAYTLTGIPFGTYDIAIKGEKNLRVVQPAVSISGSATLAGVTLPAGDGNNDNFCDTSDFGLLVGVYGADSSVPGSGYDPAADFNYDGFCDTGDFSLLVGNYGQQGDR